jgi:PAS domain S-box-containing protein
MDEKARVLVVDSEPLEELARELGILNTIGSGVDASLSPDRVAQEATNGIVASLAVDVAMLYFCEQDGLHLRGERSTDSGSVRAGAAVHRMGERLCSLVLAEGKPLYSTNVDVDPLCTIAERREAGIRSLAALPLLSGDQVLGVLVVASAIEQDLGGQGAFWEALARRIAIDVQSARLHHEMRAQVKGLERQVAERTRIEEALRTRNRELALLNRSTQAFGSTLDIGQVLASIIEEVRRLLEIVACSVWLLDASGEELICHAAAGLRSQVVLNYHLPLGQGIAGWVGQSGEILNVPDTRCEQRYYSGVDPEAALEFRSVLAVPLQAKSKVIGVLEALDSETARFGDTEVILLELLAASAAHAIENARLYESLARARQQWEEIFQAIGHPTLILDVEHCILSANRAVLRLTGQPEELLVGKKCFEVLHGSSQSARGCPMISMLDSGHMEPVEMEMEALGATFLVSCTPVCDADGRLQQIIHIATDVTDLKQAERRLEESRAELERRNQALTILNAVSSTISESFNLQQILEGVLDRVLGLTRIGAGWISVLDGDGRTLLLIASRGLSQDMRGQVERIELQAGWTDGLLCCEEPFVFTERSQGPWLDWWHSRPDPPYTLTCVPMRTRDRLLGILGVLSYAEHEMSAYEKDLFLAVGRQIGVAMENVRLLGEASAAQILRELDHLRSELIGNVSHELRTPLGLIRVLVTALMMNEIEFDRETQERFLVGIEDETNKLESIVDNLLDLSRMEGGRLRLDRHSTDLGQLVRETMTAMAPELVGHRFVCDLHDEPLVAVADRKRIEQVLRNLLSNAIKYSPGGGRVAIDGYKDKEGISICVSDEGIGIPAEEQKKIFERFYRVDNDITRRTRGAGLGLSICKWIVEAHGGQICVHSTPGKGSTFCIVLPAEL